ncbi:MAG: TolC family protein [Geobacteraceae bacterium]
MKFRVFIFLAAVFVAGSGVASGQSGGVTQINLSLLLSASPLRESPFFHSVPVGTSSGTVLRLSLGEAIERYKAADQALKASEHSCLDARELVVTAVGNVYLQTLAGEARIATARAQYTTAQTLFDNAKQMHRVGLTPGIDEIRARVELQTRHQQLIAAENDFEKQMLTLARITGLPTGQDLVLTDKAPYAPLEVMPQKQALERAYESRQDYKSSVASAHDAQISSLYAHNLAKLELARALGVAERGLKNFLGGR